MLDKNHNIKDFIGVFDGYIKDEICNDIINLFEISEFDYKVLNRKQAENASRNMKDDLSIIITRDSVGEKENLLFELMKPVREALDVYLKETDILQFAGIKELHIATTKIQKTLPSGGYHVWHCEKDYNKMCARFLVYTVYLNDIDEGGETEFLFQKTRLSPKKGRICFFPAQFPYVHRGNPPLNKEKYIVTSWFHTGHIGG